MGRWAKFKGKFEKFVLNSDKPKWLEKVEEAKASFIGLDKKELARAFTITRREKKKAEAEVSSCSATMEALSQLLVENLEAEEIQKIKLDSGETVYLQDEPYATITDRPSVIEWLKKHKMGALLTVHFKTYNSIIKERIENGEEIPPGTKIFLKTSARVTGGPRIEGEEDE